MTLSQQMFSLDNVDSRLVLCFLFCFPALGFGLKCYVYHPLGNDWDPGTPTEPSEDVTCEDEAYKWCVKYDINMDYVGDYDEYYEDFEGVCYEIILN